MKSKLNKIEKLRFIFADSTFIESDKSRREDKQFQIKTDLGGIKALSGSRFVINLKNELKGKSVARECKKWIEKKVEFKTIVKNYYIQPHINLESKDKEFVYMRINEFSSAGLGYEKDNSILNQIIKTDDYATTKQYLEDFKEIWQDNNLLKYVTNEVAGYIANLYKENSPEFIYYLTPYNIIAEFLEDISEDEFAEETIGLSKTESGNEKLIKYK